MQMFTGRVVGHTAISAVSALFLAIPAAARATDRAAVSPSPPASNSFASADILGARLGMPIDAATKAVANALSSGTAKATPQIFSGQLSLEQISTPTIVFGAHVRGSLDQVDITSSAKPGVGVIAITRQETFYNVPEPTITDFEQKIISKYGQPARSDSQFGAPFLWWTLNSTIKPRNVRSRAGAFCTQALDVPNGNQVQNGMARGNYSVPPLQEQAKCGTWMAVRINSRFKQQGLSRFL